MATHDNHPTVCFVALNSYNLLARSDDLEHIGGAELQQTLIARELASRGHSIRFVTLDYGQADGIEHDGIRVFKTCSSKQGLPVVRFIHPRWTSLCQAMKRADADVYYQRTGGLETGQVAMWCRRRDRRFVFAAAVDYDCERQLRHLTDRRSKSLYRYGLRNADRVIAQTEEQKRLFRDNFNLSSTVIRSCGFDPGGDGDERQRPSDTVRVLWLGRFCPQKGLERLLDLAVMCPRYEFDLIGNCNLATDYARAIKSRASTIANVNLVGWVPNEKVDPYYRRASFLLCTSNFEGFPNTFMEAWARGVPVASTLDPDDLIANNQLGFVSNDLEELAKHMHAAVQSSELWSRYSSNARRYFVQNHAVNVAASAYEQLFCELATGTSREPNVNSRAVASHVVR